MYQECIELLESRGVTIDDIAECALFLQKEFSTEITHEDVLRNIHLILKKREVQHVVLTGINLDIAAENQLLASKSLEALMLNDASLYGVDEVLAYGICNIYGSIALTNFGYIDRVKPLIIGKLNQRHATQCNTFLDDIVGAIAASAASRMAHLA